MVALGLLAGCSSSEDDAARPTPSPPVASVPSVPSATLAPLPLARTEVAGTSWRRLVVAVGGITSDGAASDRVDLYDPASDRWRSAPPLPLPLHHAGVAAAGERVYVAGGFTNRPGEGWQTRAGVFSLGPDDLRWRDEPSLASPRGALVLAAVGERLVAVGGVPDEGLRRTEVLVVGERSWRSGPDTNAAREHLAVAVSGGRVYAIGGRVGGLESNLESVESWDPTAAGGWRVEPALNDSRGGTSAAEVGGRPCVAGGEEPGGTIASVECLEGGRWERVARLAVPRHGLAVAAVGDRLHVAGGGPQPGLSVSDAHEVFDLG